MANSLFVTSYLCPFLTGLLYSLVNFLTDPKHPGLAQSSTLQNSSNRFWRGVPVRPNLLQQSITIKFNLSKSLLCFWSAISFLGTDQEICWTQKPQLSTLYSVHEYAQQRTLFSRGLRSLLVSNLIPQCQLNQLLEVDSFMCKHLNKRTCKGM